MSFWLRQGRSDARSAHIGFVAKNVARYSDGATDNGALDPRLYYDPRYYAATIFDPDGYSIKVVYKSWQHLKS